MDKRRPVIYLRKWREIAGLTQEQLAEITGIKQAQISAIERAVSFPSVQRLIEIKEALNAAGATCTFDDLLGYEDPEKESTLPVAS